MDTVKKYLKRKIKLKLLAYFAPIIIGILAFLIILTVFIALLGGGAANNMSSCDNEDGEGVELVDDDKKPSTDTLKEQLENAKKVAAVLEEYGLDKNKAYGAIGNAQQESSLMAPFIELNFLWKYWKDVDSVEDAEKAIQKHGSKAEGLFVNGWSSVLSAYGGGGLDESGYKGGSPDGSHWVGFGLWQWTGYNGVKPYFDFADANNLKRADIDTMLAFAVSDSSKYFKPYTAEGDYYFKRLEKIKKMPDATSPAEGADIWLNNYEYGGSAPSGGFVHLSQRQQYATDWAVRLGKETLDTNYAKSILSIANTASAMSDNEANEDEEDCSSGSSAKGDGGHPYVKDYYWTAAFRHYNKAGTIRASNFGTAYHNGVDLVADWSVAFGPKFNNKEIVSVFDGTVVGKSPGYGQILIKSEPKDTKLEKAVVLEYTHLLIDDEYASVQVGDNVKAGDVVGTEGDTGSPGLHHLHFGVLNAEAVASGKGLWHGAIPNDTSNSYGSSVDNLIIDPSLVIEGLEVGWMDSGSDNYLGDGFIQPNPLKIRVDGKTAEDPRIKGKGK